MIRLKFLLMCLGAAAFAACVKVTEVPSEPTTWSEQSVGTFSFTSEIGDVTKVGLSADNYLYWTSGDKMAVYAYMSDALFQKDIASLSVGEGTAMGQFTPEHFPDNTSWYDADDATQDYAFYAWYPASATETPDGSNTVPVTNVLPTQKESQGVGPYLVCWAHADMTKAGLARGTAPNFTFTPKSALLKLTIKNDQKVTIRFSSIQISAASVNIAGNASLNLETGELAGGDSKSITYISSSPIEMAAGSMMTLPVYISLLPCAPGTLSVLLSGEGITYTSGNVSLATAESGRSYARVSTVSAKIQRELDIVNNNSGDLADSDALDADRSLYYGNANCLVMGKDETHAVLDIVLRKSGNGYSRNVSGSLGGLKSAVNKAIVLWAESDLYEDPNFCIPAGNTDHIVVQKSAGVTGNALIGIYEGNNLLWSFHIWCPADNSVKRVTSEDSSTSYMTYTLALGQILSDYCDTYMYYQWGRKDPLGRGNAETFANGRTITYTDNGASLNGEYRSDDTGETINNLGFARRNPIEFISGRDKSSYDWYIADGKNGRAEQNDNLWRPDQATIFDPCPQGYHVAPQAAGPMFEAACLRMAPGGELSFTLGKVLGVGVSSYYWSSEVVGGDDMNARSLLWNSDTGLSQQRARGHGVRCVKNL